MKSSHQNRKSDTPSRQHNGSALGSFGVADHRPEAETFNQIRDVVYNGSPGARLMNGAVRTSAPVIQRAGPDYSGGSPEKRQMEGLKALWDVMGTVADPYSVTQQRRLLIKKEMPMISFNRIDQTLARLEADGIEAVWKDLLINSTSEELEQMYLGGRSWRWRLITNPPIGVGSEANVFWGFQFDGGRPVAIKIFKGNDQRYETAFRNEIQAHQMLLEFEREGKPIPNVVRMLDYNTYIKAVIMEHVTGYPLDKLKEELEAENTRNGNQINIPETMARMKERKTEALIETQQALRQRGYELGDVQDRNIMYDRLQNKITFIDISFDRL